MTQVTLSLPLSATALRKGAEFMTQMAQLAEVIRAEANPYAVAPEISCWPAPAEDPEPETTLADDVATAEAAPVITQETLPPVEYETIVTGHERNPEYTGANAAFDQDALVAAGWTVELLLADGYLIEVTEQRPKAVAPGASVAPSPAVPTPSAAPAPPAPDTSGVQLDGEGMPWDPRIHSDATEKLSAKGVWKRRKNTPDNVWNSVRAEYGVGNDSDTTVSPSAPAPTPAAPSAPAAPAPAPAPGAAPAAPATGNPFAEFTAWMMPQVKSGKLDQSKITLAVQKAGLTTAADLSKQPELCAQVKEDLIKTYSL
ncbi:hypothetical protein Psm1vBMR14_gp41c [Pseudomonas phage MR14]|nr:hypothetical protein Psm1vBMR14_gp41c [Pseudomonas phage MR14]